jgi:type IV pilus assembly protein PilA
MLATLKKRHEGEGHEDEGFTLIELMVVVLIIAILLAIAIPTFLGARERANDRAAQSSLRNALTAAKTIYTDNQSYASADENTTTGLKAVEPSLDYVAAGTDSTDFKTVSVLGTNTSGANWYGATASKSGKCFYIRDRSGSTGGTDYHKTTSTTCNANAGVTASGSFGANGW